MASSFQLFIRDPNHKVWQVIADVKTEQKQTELTVKPYDGFVDFAYNAPLSPQAWLDQGRTLEAWARASVFSKVKVD